MLPRETVLPRRSGVAVTLLLVASSGYLTSAVAQISNAQNSGGISPSIEGRITVCSAAYHAELDKLRTTQGPALSSVYKTLRTADPSMPGRWLFSQSLFVKPKPAPKPERYCAESETLKSGRTRCVRFETRQPPAPPPEVEIKAPPSPDDFKLLRAVHDAVEAKGAVPDVGGNGRYNFTVQRLAQDLRMYIGQPAHPALCAGSAELTEFYYGQITPIRKRLDDVTALAVRAKDMSIQRVRDIASAEMKVYDKAVTAARQADEAFQKAVAEQAAAAAAGAARSTDTAAVPTTSPVPPVAPPKVVVVPKPAEAAAAASLAALSIGALTAEAVRAVLPETAIAAIRNEASALQALTRAKAEWLDPANAGRTVSDEVRQASAQALRLIEARLYAEFYAERFRGIDTGLFQPMIQIKAAADKTCTCAD